MSANLFNLAVNTSGISQGYYDKFGDSVVVPANFATDFRFISFSPSGKIRRIGSFAVFLRRRGIKRFGILRTFALGDLLLLVPVVRHLREVGFDPYLITRKGYVGILDRLGIGAKDEHNFFNSQNGDYGIKLDGTVERDHIQKAFQKFHRSEIYFQAIGLNEWPKELDWSCELEKFPEIERDDKYVVIQGKGSTKHKSLPDRTITALLDAINEEGIRAIYIGQNARLNLKHPEMTELAFWKYKLPQLVSVIAGARCLVCMDSSPFWLSHFTKTPVVGLFGPTDPVVRVKYHPLNPDGCIGLELNDLVGCKHCFEAARRCKGRFSCLNVASAKVVQLAMSHIRRFWES